MLGSKKKLPPHEDPAIRAVYRQFLDEISTATDETRPHVIDRWTARFLQETGIELGAFIEGELKRASGQT